MIDRNQHDLREQVELLKGYADQGRSLPLITGSIFVVWGLVVAAGGMLSRAALLGGDAESVPRIWIGATVLGWLASVATRRILRLNSREGHVSHGNHVARVVWLTVGIVISGYANLAILTNNGLARTIPTVSMLIAGLAFNATAAASASRALYIPGVGYIGLALSAVALQWRGAETQLAVAAGALFFLVVPGLYLLIKARPFA